MDRLLKAQVNNQKVNLLLREMRFREPNGLPECAEPRSTPDVRTALLFALHLSTSVHIALLVGRLMASIKANYNLHKFSYSCSQYRPQILNSPNSSTMKPLNKNSSSYLNSTWHFYRVVILPNLQFSNTAQGTFTGLCVKVPELDQCSAITTLNFHFCTGSYKLNLDLPMLPMLDT